MGDFLQRKLGLQASMGIIAFVAKAIGEKKQELAQHPEKDGRGKDFLTRYVEIVEKDSSLPPW